MLTAATIAIRTITRTVVTGIRGHEASMNGHAYVRWKIALARMHDANMAATEITQQGQLTSPAARQIAEYHRNRYFEMVEARMPQLRREGRAMISATSAGGPRHNTASTFKPVRLIPAPMSGAAGAMGSMMPYRHQMIRLVSWR